MIRVHSDARPLTHEWYSWGVPSLHAKDVFACFPCVGWPRWGQDDNPSHQPEQPHVHTRCQYHSGTLSHTNTTPGSKHHAHASGTPELDHRIPRRSGSSDQTAVREPGHEILKVVPDTRDVQRARQTQRNREANLRQDSGTARAWEAWSLPTRWTTDELPEELHLGLTASYSVSTVTGRGVVGKVKLHFC